MLSFVILKYMSIYIDKYVDTMYHMSMMYNRKGADIMSKEDKYIEMNKENVLKLVTESTNHFADKIIEHFNKIEMKKQIKEPLRKYGIKKLKIKNVPEVVKNDVRLLMIDWCKNLNEFVKMDNMLPAYNLEIKKPSTDEDHCSVRRFSESFVIEFNQIEKVKESKVIFEDLLESFLRLQSLRIFWHMSKHHPILLHESIEKIKSGNNYFVEYYELNELSKFENLSKKDYQERVEKFLYYSDYQMIFIKHIKDLLTLLMSNKDTQNLDYKDKDLEMIHKAIIKMNSIEESYWDIIS